MDAGREEKTCAYDIPANSQRILIEVALKPRQGDRFQPTGFPDIGAAVYERPDGTRMILVESAQSMANRLEEVCLAENRYDITDDLKGIPYIRARLKDDSGNVMMTSSLTEAHRINSPYIISDKKFQSDLKKMAEYEKGKVLDWQKAGKALLFYDTNSLLHGTFLANLEDGRMKVPRIITAFIEAEGVREVESGGVKINPFDPSGLIRAESNLKANVYGNVPYHRMEYTAKKIIAYFNIDLSLIDGYGLDESARKLLISLSLYKVMKFLDRGLRLRTSCDLMKDGDIIIKEPQGFKLPEMEKLKDEIRRLIGECREKKIFADPPVTEVETKVTKVKDKGGKDEDNEQGSDEGEGGD